MTARLGRRHAGCAPRGRRGGVLPLVCVVLTVLVGAAALGLDLAQLYYAGVEAQAGADAAALAATRFRQYQPWAAVTDVQNRAAWLASFNRGAGQPVAVLASDVVPVNYDPKTKAITASSWSTDTYAVQVTSQVRVPSLLRGIFGDSARRVRRVATGWIANINGANCVRPFSTVYTRWYEEGYTHDTRYTATNTKATDLTLSHVAIWQYSSLQGRTFVVLAPGLREAHYDSLGLNNHGNWIPADFEGGGLNTYTSEIGAPVGSSQCRAATAAVGDSKVPLAVSDPAALISATNTGMAQLCNRVGTAADAHCYTSTGAVGVKARILISDTVTTAAGVRLNVRQVGVVRVMCYWSSPNDVCNDVPMSELAANGTWTNNGPRTGYPAGTIAMMLDSPGSTAITPDLVLGNTPGLTQRVILVK